MFSCTYRLATEVAGQHRGACTSLPHRRSFQTLPLVRRQRAGESTTVKRLGPNERLRPSWELEDQGGAYGMFLLVQTHLAALIEPGHM